jgi:hypothetical protein
MTETIPEDDLRERKRSEWARLLREAADATPNHLIEHIRRKLSQAIRGEGNGKG